MEGRVVLAQSPYSGPVWISATINGLPRPRAKYDFAINERSWDGEDCATAGDRWNPT